MPKKNLVEIICVIDRSGSMEAIKSDAIGGFNTFLDAQKKLPGEAKMTVVLFNHGYKFIQKGTDIQDVPPFDQKTYVPEGTTALLDAVGRTIDDTGKRLADTPEGERPEKVIFAILTDGLENASKDYTREKIHEMIKHQRENYAWEFIFLAANQDAFAEAEKICIDRSMAYNFEADGDGVRKAMDVMCCEVSAFRVSARKNQKNKKA
jgi:hypothetical protein